MFNCVTSHIRCQIYCYLFNSPGPECTDFNNTHNKCFIASSMEELFETIHICNVLDFIKEIFYDKL